MTFSLVILVISIELAMFFRASRKSSFLPFPHGIMLYIILGQIVLFFTATGLLHSEFLKIYSSFAFVQNVISITLLLFLFYIFLYIFVPENKFSLRDVLLNQELGNTSLVLGAILLYCHAIIVFLVIDLGLAWANSVYLLMSSTLVLKSQSGIGLLAISVMKIMGLLSWSMSGYLYKSRNHHLFISVIPVSLFYLFYQIADHSRYSAAYIIVFSAIIYLDPKNKFKSLVGLIIGTILLFAGLGGRNSGHHGFSSLVYFFRDIQSFDSDSFGFLIINIFEGIFVSSEIFRVDHVYDAWYKVLALAPSISAIDGYDKYALLHQVRLHEYVPMSLIVELYQFGYIYILFYFLVITICAVLNKKLIERSKGIGPLVANSMMFMALFLQFTYPTRTVMRLVYIVLFLSIFLMITQSRNNKSNPLNEFTPIR